MWVEVMEEQITWSSVFLGVRMAAEDGLRVSLLLTENIAFLSEKYHDFNNK